jgi:type II secretion system protein J
MFDVPQAAFSKLRTPLARAFTLLEIMVAIGLFSLIIIAIYSSWTSILKGSKVGLEAAAAVQRQRITMRALEDSLLSAQMFTANANYYSFLADADGDFASLSFVARLPKSFPRSGRFGDLNVRRVSFTVESGHESKRQLVLRQTPLLMDPDKDKDEQENPLVLARDVNKFILEFWDTRTGDWASEWTATNQLPQMVRITLELKKSDASSVEPSEVTVRTVALPANAVRPDWQMPNLGAGGLGVPNRGGVQPGNQPGPIPGQNPGQFPGGPRRPGLP